MGSAGTGSAPHVAGELFKMMTGVDLIHVPYRGSAPALTDMLGGQVQVMFDPVPSSIEYIRTGKLRALAATTAKRLDVLPGIPTVSDFLPGFEASSWQGLCAPKKAPTGIIEMVNKEVNNAIADPKIKARLADLGAMAAWATYAVRPKQMLKVTMCADLVREHRQRFATAAIQLLFHNPPSPLTRSTPRAPRVR